MGKRLRHGWLDDGDQGGVQVFQNAFILIVRVGLKNRLPTWRYSAYYRVHLHCQSVVPTVYDDGS